MGSLLPGCGGSDGWRQLSGEPVGEQQTTQEQRAALARDSVAAQLMGELRAALQEGGPKNGIAACTTKGLEIPAKVGELRGVQIGRTSHKLRNPKNTPPPWAADTVAAAGEGEVDSVPQYFTHGDGRLGVLYPIILQPQCVVCHGRFDEIDRESRPVLDELYPSDEAREFVPGELRGWFWVEVPSP